MAGRRPGGGAAEAGFARLPAACGGGRPAARPAPGRACGGLRDLRRGRGRHLGACGACRACGGGEGEGWGLAGLAGLAEGEREKDGGLQGLPGLRRGEREEAGGLRGLQGLRRGERAGRSPPAAGGLHGRSPWLSAEPKGAAPRPCPRRTPPSAGACPRSRPLQNPAERGKINPYPPSHKGRTV